MVSNVPVPGVIVADILSIGAVVGTLTGYLPPIATILAIVWYALQVYEGKTVQKWIKARRRSIRRRRLIRVIQENHNVETQP